MLFNIGDLVTRNSYNNDTVFRITSIDNSTVYLKGVDVRLYADSPENDLKLIDTNNLDYENDDEIVKTTSEILNLDRSAYFYLPGKILHIDSDIQLSNTLSNPYKIKKKAKLDICKNHQKSSKNTQKEQKLYTP